MNFSENFELPTALAFIRLLRVLLANTLAALCLFVFISNFCGFYLLLLFHVSPALSSLAQ